MARLNKHGEIGQIEFLAHKIAYCADGSVLKNDGGGGWKVYKRIRAGIDPVDIYHKTVAKYQDKLSNNPCFAAWRSLLHETVAFSNRHIVTQLIASMPGDLDGVFSEANDYGYLTRAGTLLTVQEAVELCAAYQAAMAEAKAKETEKAI